MSFTYVNIDSTGCEGWLNLFFGDDCIAMVSDVQMANRMRNSIDKKVGIRLEDMFKNDDFSCSGCK